MDGVEERQPVDSSGDDPLARVPDRGKAGHLIAQLHHGAAMDGAGTVGVRDAHPLHENGAPFAHVRSVAHAAR